MSKRAALGLLLALSCGPLSSSVVAEPGRAAAGPAAAKRAAKRRAPADAASGRTRAKRARGLPGLQAAEAALRRGQYARAENAFRRLARTASAGLAARRGGVTGSGNGNKGRARAAGGVGKAGQKAGKARQACRALVGLARLQLEKGRYDDAERTAERASKCAAVRVQAQTLKAEALWARGELDAAERALRAVVEHRTANRARVLLGRLLLERGRDSEAEPHLMALVRAYNEEIIGEDDAEGLAYVAMAAWALGSVHDANDAFRQSWIADSTRVETQQEWAELFLEKNDAPHARESLVEALSSNPHSARSHALMARVALVESFDFPAAAEALEQALATNPNLVMAHVTRAGMALRNMQIDAAERHVAAALQINPADLEALSMRAAVRFLADDAPGFEQAKRDVLARNPRFSRMYSIVAKYAEWEHRYPQLVKMARQALALNPEDAEAYATLGINLLRMGEETRGLQALQSAWDRDRFNVYVFNILNLYEQVISSEYEQFEARPFRVRVHRDEKPVLEPYLVPMLRRAYRDMVRRYGFTPQGPISVELYSNRQHFAVRATGLPHAGVQGVCFGKVVTAISPRAAPFNWGQIVWHELAHVFHLQLSDNHVPRWFTEGLAEQETMVARTHWRREDDHKLWMALYAGRLPHLGDLNTAFTNARSPGQLMTAYYLSLKAVGFIVERYGMPKVVAMLRAWGKGKRTAQVIRQVLGVTIDELDQEFRKTLREELAKWTDQFAVDFGAYEDLAALEEAAKKTPRDPDVLAALALGYLGQGRHDEAGSVAERAIALSPNHALANFAMTRVALQTGDLRGAERCLRAIVAGGKDGYIIRLLLAQAAIGRRDHKGALSELRSAVRIDPDRLEAWRSMAEVAGVSGDQALFLEALKAIVRIDQHDRPSAVALLALLAHERQWSDLVRFGEDALFVDPENPEVHRLLGEAYVQVGRARQGLKELDQALRLGPKNPAKVHMARARAFRALGKRAAARRAEQKAKAADRSSKPEALKSGTGGSAGRQRSAGQEQGGNGP